MERRGLHKKRYIVRRVALGILFILAVCTGAERLLPAERPPVSPPPPPPPGSTGRSFAITNFHGSTMLAKKRLTEDGKYEVKATITSATADPAGKVTVNFKVEDAKNNPVAGIKGVSFNIARLVPKEGGESFNKWVPYTYRSQVVTGSAKGNWPKPDGTAADQGYRESDGTFTDNGNGTYSYVFKTNISNVVTPVGKKPIRYNRTLTHRVSMAEMRNNIGSIGLFQNGLAVSTPRRTPV